MTNGTSNGGTEVSVRVNTPRERVRLWFMNNLLLVLTLISVTLGIVLGLALRATQPSKDAILIIGFPGDILMRMLKMLILPLITASLITGLTQMDARSSSKLGVRALVYYMTTTFIAVIIGMFLVMTIQPGKHSNRDDFGDGEQEIDITTLDTFLDLLRNFFPNNLVQACFQQTQTYYREEDVKKKKVNISWSLEPNEDGQLENVTTRTVEYLVVGKEMVRDLGYKNGMNVLGIIAFCVAFGMLLSTMGPRGRVMVDFFSILNDIIMRLVNLVMWYSPVGIMSLICAKILSMDEPDRVFAQLGLYMVTVLIGLVIHLGVLMLIYFLMTRKNPFTFFHGMLQAWLTALATSSSAATLPVTFRCLEENNNIDYRVTRFVIPIGATVNMDGTALYEAVASIFIGQLNGFNMTFGRVISVSVTATLASIGAASVPSAGLITMLMVLTAAGFPTEDVSLLLTVDWFLDRCRTSVNVLGDSYGAAIVEKLSRKELDAARELEYMEGQMQNHTNINNEKRDADEHTF